MKLPSYISFLKTHYPQTHNFLKQKQWGPPLFNETIDLPIAIYQQIEQTVKSLYQLKNNKTYQNSLLSQAMPILFENSCLTEIPAFERVLSSGGRLNKQAGNFKPNQSNFNLKDSRFCKNDSSAKHSNHKNISNNFQKQDSVLMAYDFHLTNNTAKLIEINTNASAFLLVNSLYQFKNLQYKKALEDLKNSFQQQWSIFNNKVKSPKKTILIDREPFKQKMAIEFFMYKDFFQSMGWDMEILDSKQLKTDDKYYLYTPENKKINFIYNRLTDFYFENHPALTKAYQKNTCLTLPQPKDYFLLADKARMCNWLAEDWQELRNIKNNLLITKILSPDNKQELWKNRKKYFFKISQGYGGKMAYKGASLSRKKFEELCQYSSLAQEYIAPSKVIDSHNQEWKLDLRAYVYKDQIQQLTGRVYQGQLTNFKAPGSGFALIRLLA